jgi:hypothetical protein
MNIQEYLQNVVKWLESCFGALSSSIPAPVFLKDSGYPRFRHTKRDDLLVSYLKGIQIVSSLNAALVLLRHGYVQEVGTLCRSIDDFVNEIYFLAAPLGDNGLSEDQRRFVEEFFQEEFSDTRSPLTSQQKRDRVPRRKIHAGLAKIQGQTTNPSDVQRLLDVNQKAFSGYVHGAYVHIMDIYGGSPPRFFTSGLLGTPKIEVWERQLTNQVYRAMMASIVIAQRAPATEITESLYSKLKAFERDLDLMP